jgi:hypothetical protein
MGTFKSSLSDSEPEVTVDELDKYGNFDAFEVKNKKPGFRYRFVNMNERNVADKMRQGYQVVGDNDQEQIAFSDNTPLKAGSSIDTTRRFNDVMLMRIPEEKFQRNQRFLQALRDRRSLATVENQFKSEVGPAAYKEPGRGRYSESMTEGEFFGTSEGEEE